MKKKIIRIFKGLTLAAALLLVIGVLLYTMAWFAVTKRAEAYLIASSKDPSLTITGDIPSFSGYPLPPEAKYSGTIEHASGLKIEIPQLNYSGFPVPNQLQYFEAPNGFNISAPFLDRLLNIEFAALQVRVPRTLPNTMKSADIEAWQKSDDPFLINKLVLNSGYISAIGSGTLTLDENLQIKANIQARVVGMDRLLDDIEKEQGKKNVTIARNFLNMLSKTDDATGQKYFETTLKIQNRGIYFGPMRLTGLPEIKWSGQTATVPRRDVPSQ